MNSYRAWRILTNLNCNRNQRLNVPSETRKSSSNFYVTHPVTEPCERYLTEIIAGRGANTLCHRASATLTLLYDN